MDTQIMPKPRLELLPVTPVIQLESGLNKPLRANKSSCIDTFSDRNVNTYEFTKGLAQALNDDSFNHWFLN